MAVERRLDPVRPIVPVVLAGGAGSRLWPLSRTLHPKPFHPLFGERSLLQETLLRAGRVADRPPIVVCNEAHRFLAAEQIRALPAAWRQIVLEPEARGTAPAVALAAHLVRAELEDALLLVLPADHYIDDATGFEAAVETAAAAAAGAHRPVVCFGIEPTRPETGYGYIELPGAGRIGVQPVRAFVEKPDRKTARGFLASGRHLWNSGMFLMHVETGLAEIAAHSPDTATAVAAAFASGRADRDCFRAGPAYADSPAGSFDRVVMERTGNAVVVPAAFGWRDLGAWDAVLEESDRDDDGNRLNGDVLARGVTNSLIHARARLVAAVGLEGVVVVETADAVLVAGMDRVADVGGLVADMTRAGRPETGLHTEVGRSWGRYERLGQGEGFQVKCLRLDPGASISLQVHRHRAEHWVVVRGVAEVTRDERTFALRKNESAWIPTGARHRLHNPGTDVLEVIEVQVGDYLGEDDIVRFEDPQSGTDEST